MVLGEGEEKASKLTLEWMHLGKEVGKVGQL